MGQAFSNEAKPKTPAVPRVPNSCSSGPSPKALSLGDDARDVSLTAPAPPASVCRIPTAATSATWSASQPRTPPFVMALPTNLPAYTTGIVSHERAEPQPQPTAAAATSARREHDSNATTSSTAVQVTAAAVTARKRRLPLQPSLVIPLQPAVLGFDRLEVLVVQLKDVHIAYQEWLLQGWDLHAASAAAATATVGSHAAAAATVSGRKQPQPQQQRLPKVMGIDTEFVGDQLALVQLCCGGRALLVQMPQQRSSRSGTATLQQQQKKEKQQHGGGQSAGAVEGRSSTVNPPEHPLAWPPVLKSQLCDPSLPKAAAEVWQDTLVIFATFGLKLRNGLDLTVACPPSEEEKKRGRRKLPLFAIFESFFPVSNLAKDKTINHELWFASTLNERQIKYGALDAFVSYAAGVRVVQRTAPPLPSPVDLTLPSHSEVLLAAQWVAVSQFQEVARQTRTATDFCSAQFEVLKKKGLVLVVRMSRFKTRLRKGCWVEVRLAPPDGRRLHGRCVHQSGKTAHVANLCWAAGSSSSASTGTAAGHGSTTCPRDVRIGDVSTDQVQHIEMEEVQDTTEAEKTKDLIREALNGARKLLDSPIATGIFGGGTLRLPPPSRLPASAGAAAAAAARAAPGTTIREAVAALHAAGRVNGSQREALEAILVGERAVQLVQGPPGSGKTSVISHTVDLWVRLLAPALPPVGPGGHEEAMACVARSNVAAKNIALALIKRGLGPAQFRLVVSHEYHFEWHEEQYRGALEAVLITSDELEGTEISRRLHGVQVFVTTVSMLSSKKFRTIVLYGKKLTRLLIDEASQIYAGDVLLPVHMYGKHLRSLSLFGDDVQLPPYGSAWDGALIHSLFDQLTPPDARAHARLRSQPHAFSVGPPLTLPRGATAGGGGSSDSHGGSASGGGGAHRVMLSVSYRLPPLLCGFISHALYGGLLRSGRAPEVVASLTGRAIRWVDVEGQEEGGSGSSFRNRHEAAAVLRHLRADHELWSGRRSWTVITGYDLQRTLLEKELGKHLPMTAVPPAAGASGGADRTSGDRVYNIDTFQGREDEVVIASLVRSGTNLGFMRDDRRVNVMLTRCTHQLVVVGRLALALANPETLIGRMAAHCVREGLVERGGGGGSGAASTALATTTTAAATAGSLSAPAIAAVACGNTAPVAAPAAAAYRGGPVQPPAAKAVPGCGGRPVGRGGGGGRFSGGGAGAVGWRIARA